MIREQSPPADPFAERPGARLLPRVGVAEAVRRHKLLALLPVLALVGLALAYGLSSTPTYTAEARQIIGRIDVNQPGALAGFQEATRTLATSYSRGIAGTDVVNRVSRRTGLSPDQVRSRLTAYPIPESAVFVVSATGPSVKDAINVTLEGTRALRAYIEQINAENPNSDRLLREFRAASLERAQLRQEYTNARAAFAGRATPEQQQELASLRSQLDAAGLQVGVARNSYGASQASQSTVSLVQNLSLPETATNDRFERLQLLLFFAVSAGVLLGLALATLRSNREVRRALSVR